MLHLDKGLAQYFCVIWTVLEESLLFWGVVVKGLAHVHIPEMLELSVLHVSYSSNFWTGTAISYRKYYDNIK